MQGGARAVYREAHESLEAAGLAHALVGATALGRFTLPRATLDMDFLVEEAGARLDARLRGLQLVEKTRDAFFDQDAYLFEVPTYPTPVEMFVATHPLTKAALARRETVALPPFGEVPLLRVEDTILLKAHVAAHPSRPSWKRDLDHADLRLLAASGAAIDVELLRSAALPAPASALLEEAGILRASSD